MKLNYLTLMAGIAGIIVGTSPLWMSMDLLFKITISLLLIDWLANMYRICNIPMTVNEVRSVCSGLYTFNLVIFLLIWGMYKL